MSYPTRSPHWYRYLRFWKRDIDGDVDAELRFHFDARIDELVGQGLSPSDAQARALAEFGDVSGVRTHLREIDGRVARRRDRSAVIGAVVQDIRYSARALRRSPAVSLTIILTLALGLGVNAAMFSLLDVVFLRPPAGVAFPDQIRRVWLYRTFMNGSQFWSGFDYTAYDALRHTLDGQAELAIYRSPSRRQLGRAENAPTANVAATSASFFTVLGVRPAIGRFYTPDEDRLDDGAPVAVISDAFWRRERNADRDVVGQALLFGDQRYTIIGVAPPHFIGTDMNATDVWLPLSTTAGQSSRPNMPWYKNQNINGFQIMFRLRPGAREPEMEQRATVALRRARGDSERDTAMVARLGSIITARGPGNLRAEVQVATRLAGVAIIVLVIACANVVNLLLARAVRRRREIAVRLALGISRARLVCLLVTESVLLSMVAAAGAVAAAMWGGALLRKVLMPEITWGENPLHVRVLVFALLAAVSAGIVAGLVPALQSTSPNLTSALKAGWRDGGAHRSRLRSFLVICQAALSVVLLVGAALFVRSLHNVHVQNIGYAVDELAFVSVDYDHRDKTRDAATSARLVQLEQRLASVPGVERVAYTSMRPKWGIQFVTYFPEADTVGRKKPTGIYSAVSPGFFAATGTKLLRGRTFPAFGATAATDPPSVIVNTAMADALWPNEDPLGRCIHFEKSNAPCATVIGVAQTAMLDNVTEKLSPHLYLPLDHMPTDSYGSGDLILRVNPARMTSAVNEVRAMLRAEFPGATPSVSLMATAMEPEYRPWRLGATLFTLFGVLAALVAGIGIYSTVSYAVSQRTHEFGVRAALGASAANVLGQVLGEGLRTVMIGVATGIALAMIAGRLVASLLYGISPRDPAAIAGAGALLIVIAVAASLVPAWRAARADPVNALRAD